MVNIIQCLRCYSKCVSLTVYSSQYPCEVDPVFSLFMNKKTEKN